MKHINLFFAILTTTLLLNGLVFPQDTALTVTSTGKVGIGTTSPSEHLHVWRNLQVGDPSNLWTDSTDNRIIKFGNGEFTSIGEVGGNDRLQIMGNPISMEGDIVIHGGISMGGLFGMVGDFIIDGNVGIGKPSSGSRLEINDNLATGPMLLLNNANASGDVAIDFQSAGAVQANVYYEPTGDYLSINSINKSNTVLNATGGNVGIGIANPGQKLSVAGAIESTSGGFRFPDGTIQTSAAGGGGNLWSTSGLNIYYNSGNVGIGTANPESYLEVHGLGGSGKNGRVQTSAGDVKAFFDARDEGIPKELGQLGTKTNHDFAFYTNDSERMRITNNGNVGIGTTAPTVPLEIQGPGNSYQDLIMEFENTTSGQRFVLYNDATSGKESFNIAQPMETPSLTIMASGSPGNVGIGTQSPNYKLHVNGSAAGISWTNLSSRDYKENITKISANEHQKMLNELMKVDINTYRYKDNFGGDGTTKIGFIAEEMPKEVLSKDGKGVDVYELLAYTIGAMKAQQKKIEELEARLNNRQ